MKKPVDPLTQSLISPSEDLEGSALRSRPGMEAVVENLAYLDALAELTQKSMPLEPQTSEPSQVAPSIAPKTTPAPAPAASIRQPVAPPEYNTSRPEYQKALKSQKLVEALLAFHHESRPLRRGSAAAPASGMKQKNGNRMPQRQQAAPGPFQPPKVPVLQQVESKPANFSRRPAGSAYPILRSKPKVP